MKFLLLYLMLVSSVFGLPQRSLHTRRSSSAGNTHLGVFHGNDTTIERHPSQVFIRKDNKYWCMGTIIYSNWTITSGDCGLRLESRLGTIVAGSTDGVHGQKYDALQIVVHPSFKDGYLDYNFALIQTSKPFKLSDKVKIAKVTKNCPKAGAKYNVAGYGDKNANRHRKTNRTMTEGIMEILDNELCEEYYTGFDINWTKRLACAYNKGNTTLCLGDWGLGFVGSDETEDTSDSVCYSFLTVASSGYCSTDAEPVIVSNIASVADWIIDTINGDA